MSNVDLTARFIAIAGLALAVGSILVNWYLWHSSGPNLRVSAFVRAETGRIHIEVVSSGRLTATVRAVELRDHFTIPAIGGGTRTMSRWAMPAQPSGRAGQVTLPMELAPTDYLEADIEVRLVLAKSDGASEVNVRAWVQRGDGKWYSSRPLRLR